MIGTIFVIALAASIGGISIGGIFRIFTRGH